MLFKHCIFGALFHYIALYFNFKIILFYFAVNAKSQIYREHF